MKMTESQKVAAAAWRIRRYALQMGEVQGQGYIGQALGYADVLATAFSHAMTYRPEDPEWEGRDRFLLSPNQIGRAVQQECRDRSRMPSSA